MNPKQKFLPTALLAWTLGAACFTAADVAAARVQPPPKPPVSTIVEPGTANRQNDIVAHSHRHKGQGFAMRGHHHKGHIKKDKSNEQDANINNSVKK